MQPVLGVDFETYSAADIGDGASAYAEHETTGVHCAVLMLSSGPGVFSKTAQLTWENADLPEWAADHIRAGHPVLAHNCAFEAAVIRYVLAPNSDWIEPAPEQWEDTTIMAAAVALPQALGLLGPVIGATVTKDEDGNKLMRSLSKVTRDVDGQWVYPKPTPQQLARLLSYCETDVRSMFECYWRLPKLLPVERRMAVLDRVINNRGVQIDLPFAAKMRAMADARKEQIGDEVWEITEDLVGVSNVPSFTRWVERQGVVLPKVTRKKADGSFTATPSVDRASLGTLLSLPDLPPMVHEVLIRRLEAGRLTSLAKLDRVATAVNSDGRLRGMFRFSKAHTGRWTSEIVQLHNLAKPTKSFKKVAEQFYAAVRASDIEAAGRLWPILEGLSFSLRALVVGAEGCDLIGGDFAAIEARVLAWLAGQEDTLALFASGADVYTADAAAIGSDDRQLGKVARLGLGYGMGVIKFRDQAAKAGVELSLKRAREVQLGWRNSNLKIVQFWQDLHDGFRMALRDPGSTFRAGLCTIDADEQCLRIELPSGRKLHYWRPSVRTVMKKIESVDAAGNIVVMHRESEELRYFTAGGRGMEAESTYGGSLAENVTQAVARDILRDALLRLDDAGYNLVLHVHDSIAAETPTAMAKEVEADFGRLMSVVPAWAEGLPLAVETYRSRHFKG